MELSSIFLPIGAVVVGAGVVMIARAAGSDDRSLHAPELRTTCVLNETCPRRFSGRPGRSSPQLNFVPIVPEFVPQPEIG
jgi:hypothetical protein